jgi:hypothetical protein
MPGPRPVVALDRRRRATGGQPTKPGGHSLPLLSADGTRKKTTSALFSVKKTMVVPMTSGPHLKEQYHIKSTDFLLSCKIYISYLVAPKIVQFFCWNPCEVLCMLE